LQIFYTRDVGKYLREKVKAVVKKTSNETIDDLPSCGRALEVRT
jgi:hypothetical protein